uniref:Uncharacterized protein n=1 Tax=Globodera rostochiensis TaxID=31243 RepID=A0A914HBZ9_GLORO
MFHLGVNLHAEMDGQWEDEYRPTLTSLPPSICSSFAIPNPHRMTSLPLLTLFSVLLALQLIGQSFADEFEQVEDQDLLNPQQLTIDSNRNIRSLANGRWQLRPGKRASLIDFRPMDGLGERARSTFLRPPPPHPPRPPTFFTHAARFLPAEGVLFPSHPFSLPSGSFDPPKYRQNLSSLHSAELLHNRRRKAINRRILIEHTKCQQSVKLT